MKLVRLLPIAWMALPTVVAAQTGSAGGVSTQRELWKDITRNFSLAATEVPESLYAFRPAPTVRTFGQIVGHVAGSQFSMCAVALGEPARPEDAVERSKTTKADLVAALQASTEFCEKAYAQTDAVAQRQAELFGRMRTRLWILGLNAIHNGEHYGNLVTYMRIKGLVPPSSRPAPTPTPTPDGGMR
jgi:uncharacterized damage-inducible protein DinB